MKKVLFVASVTSHIIGFHIPYLKWFKENGYEVHVASNGEKNIDYCDKHFEIPFERSPFKLKNIKAYKELKKVINNEKYEIIHCHTPMASILTRLSARKSRKINNTKVIYTAHGFHFFKGAPLINWLVFYPIEKLVAHYTDCLITINKEDYQFAKKHLKAKRIELVHGVGVNENKFDFEITDNKKIEIRKSLGLEENDFVIIYPAELSKRKNQSMLLQSMALLKKEGYKNIKVLLPGTDSMNGMYQKMAKDLNLENEIKFLGYRKDIPELMKISDLAVSTSKQEGLPVNIMEAMMSGLPIIATDCRGNRDIANEVVEIDNVEQLVDKIIDCMNNREKYVCKKCKEYKLENVIKEMEKIYKIF